MPKNELLGIIIPNHEKELQDCSNKLDTIKYEIKQLAARLQIDDDTHTRMYEEIATVLDYVAGLSLILFKIEDELKEKYEMRYLKSPALGQTLFLKDYGKAHHPYNLIKNRCYRMFTELDTAYVEENDKNPPNWKDSLNLDSLKK